MFQDLKPQPKVDETDHILQIHPAIKHQVIEKIPPTLNEATVAALAGPLRRPFAYLVTEYFLTHIGEAAEYLRFLDRQPPARGAYSTIGEFVRTIVFTYVEEAVPCDNVESRTRDLHVRMASQIAPLADTLRAKGEALIRQARALDMMKETTRDFE